METPVVEFTGIQDEGPDKGMMARIIGVHEEAESIVFTVQLNEFFEYNKVFEQKNWFNDKGVARLGWSETKSYPSDGKYEVWTDALDDVEIYFSLVDVSPTYKRYKESRTELGYIQWLETEVERLSK